MCFVFETGNTTCNLAVYVTMQILNTFNYSTGRGASIKTVLFRFNYVCTVWEKDGVIWV